jgi:ADP-ribosylglycohydrolase
MVDGEQRAQKYRRVVACFQALAIGDAIGKQTETLSRANVLRWYPEGISGFHGQAGDVIPRYRGHRRYEWRIGETTDDTEQTIAVARAALSTQPLTHTAVGSELLKCRKSLHPGVSLWALHQSSDPAYVALEGDGCGAAMRVAPAGIIHQPEDIVPIMRDAREASISTHGGSMAIAAAAAVATAISAAIAEWPTEDVLQLTLIVAGNIDRRIETAIERIHRDLSESGDLSASYIAERHFPNSPERKVPLAIALALVTQSAERTTLLAANIGGDSDTVASIGAAIAGAMRPDTVNNGWWDVVERVNAENGILETVRALAGLRKDYNQNKAG